MQFIIKLYLKTIAHITYTHVIYNLIILLLECSVDGMYGVTHIIWLGLGCQPIAVTMDIIQH